jgi:hypothetical protein
MIIQSLRNRSSKRAGNWVPWSCSRLARVRLGTAACNDRPADSAANRGLYSSDILAGAGLGSGVHWQPGPPLGRRCHIAGPGISGITLDFPLDWKVEDGAMGITRDEVRRLADAGAQLVEVLPRDEFDDEHLPGAISLPLKSLTAETSAVLDRSRPVIVYCWDGL